MNLKKSVNGLFVVVITVVALCLTGCGGSSELVYRVTGTAVEVKVAYTNAEGNVQEETVTLPWETSFEVKQKFEYELRVSNMQPAGEVKCQVLLDGRERGDADSKAYAVCMGNVQIKGSSISGSSSSYSVETVLGDVQSLINDGKLEDALAKVEGAIEDAPYFAGAYFTQGLVYKNMEEFDQSIAAYSQAITLDPEYIAVYNNRGRVYASMGEQEMAVADFTTAIELDPEYVNGYFNRTISYAELDDLEAARADVLKVQELSDDPDMLSWAEEALAELDVVELPTEAPATTSTSSASDHVDLGMEYSEQGQFDEAIAEFQKALELEPDNVDAQRNLGTAYFDQGKWEKAVVAYERAIEIDPNWDEAYGELAAVYAKLGRLEEAVAAGEKAIELIPDEASAHLNLGVAYKNQGQIDKAIIEYEKAIELDPDLSMPHYNLGIIYSGQGRLDEAVAEWEETIKLAPDDVMAHSNLGLAYYEQGRLDEAVVVLEKGLQIDPDYAGTHLNLGLAYRDVGRVDEAIAEFETYLRLKPDASNRAALEEEIAKLEPSASASAAGEEGEYRSAENGFSLRYPDGWAYSESENQVLFASSEEELETGIPGQVFKAAFMTGLLSDVAESAGLAEIIAPAVALEAWAKSMNMEVGETGEAESAGYPAAFAPSSGSIQGTSFTGDLVVILVGERIVAGMAFSPPDQWDNFRPAFVDMINSLSFFEPSG